MGEHEYKKFWGAGTSGISKKATKFITKFSSGFANIIYIRISASSHRNNVISNYANRKVVTRILDV
jgi:hypothetical protein